MIKHKEVIYLSNGNILVDGQEYVEAPLVLSPGNFYMCTSNDSSSAYEDDIYFVSDGGVAICISGDVGSQLNVNDIDEDSHSFWKEIRYDEVLSILGVSKVG